ncbi:MAG: DUF6114 domain-containing protein [Cuniculiplasma sp.]
MNYEQLTKSFSWFKQNRDSSILTMAGGIVTLYVALVELSLILSNGGLPQSQYILYYVTGLIPAILEIFFSVLMWVYNSRSGLWGVLTILVAFTSFIGTSGGLLVGFFLAFFGGIMSAIFKLSKN